MAPMARVMPTPGNSPVPEEVKAEESAKTTAPTMFFATAMVRTVWPFTSAFASRCICAVTEAEAAAVSNKGRVVVRTAAPIIVVCRVSPSGGASFDSAVSRGQTSELA
jgi:hypothetical protein